MSTSHASPKYFALVPAAGSGSRMETALSKQYLPLAGRPLIWHTLRALCAVPGIETVHVVLAPTDTEWHTHDWTMFGARLVPLFCGGATRAMSVKNGLVAMRGEAGAGDWVLVHDAARPCITPALVEALMQGVGDDAVGGILALPVADTLKRADAEQRIAATVARENLWQAQTPQIFRLDLLSEALARHPEVTDEAAAIEALGHRPRLVTGDVTNFKVTWPRDLQIAERILQTRDNA